MRERHGKELEDHSQKFDRTEADKKNEFEAQKKEKESDFKNDLNALKIQ